MLQSGKGTHFSSTTTIPNLESSLTETPDYSPEQHLSIQFTLLLFSLQTSPELLFFNQQCWQQLKRTGLCSWYSYLLHFSPWQTPYMTLIMTNAQSAQYKMAHPLKLLLLKKSLLVLITKDGYLPMSLTYNFKWTYMNPLCVVESLIKAFLCLHLKIWERKSIEMLSSANNLILYGFLHTLVNTKY